MKSIRIQRRRTLGWRMPTGAAYVGRPTTWANPWAVIQTRDGWAASWQWGAAGLGEPWHPTPDRRFVACITRADAHAEAVRLYRWYLTARPALAASVRNELPGKNLACWCPEELPCHADVLLEIANGGEPE